MRWSSTTFFAAAGTATGLTIACALTGHSVDAAINGGAATFLALHGLREAAYEVTSSLGYQRSTSPTSKKTAAPTAKQGESMPQSHTAPFLSCCILDRS
jgi:hypothetical protein